MFVDLLLVIKYCEQHFMREYESISISACVSKHKNKVAKKIKNSETKNKLIGSCQVHANILCSTKTTFLDFYQKYKA